MRIWYFTICNLDDTFVAIVREELPVSICKGGDAIRMMQGRVNKVYKVYHATSKMYEHYQLTGENLYS